MATLSGRAVCVSPAGAIDDEATTFVGPDGWGLDVDGEGRGRLVPPATADAGERPATADDASASSEDASARADQAHAIPVQFGRVEPRADGRLVEVVVDGWRFELLVEDAARAALRARATRGRAAAGQGGPLAIRAIIPGRVVAVSVVPGDAVRTGDQLLVIEAMKMQNELRAPRDGVVDRVEAAAGAAVDVGEILVVLR